MRANGGKLPPLLIFKGVPNGNISKEIKKNKYVKQHKIYVECNSNAWCLVCKGHNDYLESKYREALNSIPQRFFCGLKKMQEIVASPKKNYNSNKANHSILIY